MEKEKQERKYKKTGRSVWEVKYPHNRRKQRSKLSKK